MVAYNWDTYVWQPHAVRATPINKASALSWMQTLPLIEANIVTEAGLATLQLCDASHRAGKRIIFIGNITPFDADAAHPAITSANFRQTPIDTILIPDPHFPPAEDFWQNLAAANSGEFELITQ